MSKRNPYTVRGRNGRVTHKRFPVTEAQKVAAEREKAKKTAYVGGTFTEVQGQPQQG